MKLRNAFLLAAFALCLPIVAYFVFFNRPAYYSNLPGNRMLAPAFWQHMASPGDLSQAHASLENNCATCHTAVKGVDATKCIACHADNKALLSRQPTEFHAEINACAACHIEHQGRVATTTKMDHVALAHIGFKQLKSEPPQPGVNVVQIKRWLVATNSSPQLAATHLHPEEALLNCATCHQTKEPHRGFFGLDCAQCHETAKWTISEFRHPSAASQSCAQCHQAPPSHYMGHFKMIDQSVCGQPNAKVNQCFLCHQTTSWNDIKGIGWYKHH